MGDPRAAVVLVTDYGADDSYAGSLVGALWTADPDARWAVGTHGVPPGDVLAGAYHVKALARSVAVGTLAICGEACLIRVASKSPKKKVLSLPL